MVSLGTGGIAQWGWDTISAADRGADELVVSKQPGSSPVGAIGPQATTPAPVTSAPATPTATSSTEVTTPPARASRSADRTVAPDKPSSVPKPPRPSRSSPPAAADADSGGLPDRRSALEEAAIALTNAERTKNGCEELRADTKLRDAARGHSEDMKERGFFDHNTPDGLDPWERAEKAGYEQPTGENIARGQQSAGDVVEAWMDSPGHRRNILNCDSKAIGIGVAMGQDGPWWTQMFGAV